jgi:hypothetical protein
MRVATTKPNSGGLNVSLLIVNLLFVDEMHAVRHLRSKRSRAHPWNPD